MAEAFHNILVILPTWVGDCVMATPTLRALRRLYPEARITGLCRRNVKPLFAGGPWLDRIISFRPKLSLLRLARRLKRGRFDAAIILPGSFKSALLARSAGVPRRIGYDRDGRGFLLTDKLLPQKAGGDFVPVPAVRYYLGIAGYLGGDPGWTADRRMELFVTEAERRAADHVLSGAGVTADSPRPWVLLNPGAQYGAAKLWLPQYFAAVAERFKREQGATVLVSSAPGERRIVEEIRGHMQQEIRPVASPVNGVEQPFADLAQHGLTLGALKAICGRVDLMITNDTGPRHIAAAMGTRVVTLFGSTDPRWTTIDHPLEVELFEKVFCGPCQRKLCPLDHRCMTQLRPERVYDEATALLRREVALPVVGTHDGARRD